VGKTHKSKAPATKSKKFEDDLVAWPKIQATTLENKVRLYKAILKPVWTYGIQLWGTASNSNIEILQLYQSKILRQIVNAPFYISNASIHKVLGIKNI